MGVVRSEESKAVELACYVRLSLDHGGQTATARQAASCRAYAEARGWTIPRVYEDVDLSAYQPNVVHPAFEEMLDDIAANLGVAIVRILA